MDIQDDIPMLGNIDKTQVSFRFRLSLRQYQVFINKYYQYTLFQQMSTHIIQTM